jgi:hypothetical protein
MKPRHAAALALVGWYLMVPPVSTYNGKAYVDSYASLRRWTRIGVSFDSVTDCGQASEKTRKNVRNAEEDELESAAEQDANPGDQTLAGYEAVRQVKCFSKDDPRIKGVAIPMNRAWFRFIPAN